MNREFLALASRALTRHRDAAVVFVAGSMVRGEATPSSDLDAVVVYETLPQAYRETFVHDGVLIETLVHDPETLSYFYHRVERPSAIPVLMTMVAEGVALPIETEFSQRLQREARTLLEAGPPPLSEPEALTLRYRITDAMSDARAPRSVSEQQAALAQLYEPLAHYALRRRGRWAARGKAIPRALTALDPALSEAFIDAFALAFTHDTALLEQVVQGLLREEGGPVTTYRLEAPASWRIRAEG